MSKDSRHCAAGLPGASFARALFLGSLAIAAAAAPAAAAWSPAGFPFNTASGPQSGLRAVSDGRRGFIAAWVDTNGGVPRIFSQRVDSTGAQQWGVNGVLVNSGFGAISDLTAAPDGANGVLLAWTATRAVARTNVYVQRLNAGGTPLWGANGLIVDPAAGDTLQGSPAVDLDGAGGAIVAWSEDRGNTDPDVYVQRIASDSSRAWTAGGVNMGGPGGDDQVSPRVLGDGAGGAWVAWQNVGTNQTLPYFQRLDGAGAAQWTAGGVAPTTDDPSLYPLLSRIPGTDDLFVAWAESSPDRTRGARLDATGTVLPAGGLTLNPTSMLPFGLVAQAGGSSVLVFASASQIFAVGISSGGTVALPSTIASGQTLDATSNLTAVADGTGGLYVVWASAGTAYARHVTVAGAADWAGPVALTSGVTATQTWPVAVPGFDLLAAWVDSRTAGTTGPDLYGQRVAPNGVTGLYHRILATVAGGTGAFSQGGGRSWVRQGDSLRVAFTGSSGQHVDHTLVGATNLGPVPNYTFHAVAGDSTLQAFFSNAAITTQVGAPPGSYRAFSLPSTFSNSAVSSVFANLMPYDPARWRLGHWEADDSTYLEPTSGLTNIVPGAGYWFVGLKDTTLSFTGNAVAEAQFDLSMLRGPVSGRGWTQFGSPFRFPLAVSQLRLSPIPSVPITDPGNTYTDAQVLEWNPLTSSYRTVNVLVPGAAYWLWRQSPTPTTITLRFPYEWNPVALDVPLPLPGLVAGADWAIGITASAGEREARLTFGAAPVAAGRWNALSTHALPDGPGAGLSLVARVSDWGGDNGEYLAVFRPDAAELRWEFDASAPVGLTEAALAFEFTELPAGRRVVLSEPATGWSREVVAGANVPLVLSGNARRLRLEVLSGPPVTPPAPLATALRAAGPNPFHDATTLAFSLARGGPLRWDVFDLAGRRVVSGVRTLDAGEHALTWDGRDEAGRRVEPGLYLLRWQADGRSGTARLVRTD